MRNQSYYVMIHRLIARQRGCRCCCSCYNERQTTGEDKFYNPTSAASYQLSRQIAVIQLGILLLQEKILKQDTEKCVTNEASSE